MSDIVTPEKRSRMMARIRSKDTVPELVVRRWLHAQGYRFRLHRKDLPGKPDIVLSRCRLIIFVHGCFWHQHEGCRNANVPATRTAWWQEKFARTLKRDKHVVECLEKEGWNVATIWECETKNEGFAKRLEELLPKK